MKSILELIVNLLGLGILIWLLSTSVADLFTGNRKKTVLHNLIIIGICLIYSLKILLMDLLDVI